MTDNLYKNTEMMNKLDEFLLDIQKPARYIGGEVDSVIKDKSKVDVRFAFCFPDTYEIGMSHLGMKILYGLKNAVPNYWCERVYAAARYGGADAQARNTVVRAREP